MAGSVPRRVNPSPARHARHHSTNWQLVRTLPAEVDDPPWHKAAQEGERTADRWVRRRTGRLAGEEGKLQAVGVDWHVPRAGELRRGARVVGVAVGEYDGLQPRFRPDPLLRCGAYPFGVPRRPRVNKYPGTSRLPDEVGIYYP